MADVVLAYLQKHGARVLEAALQRVVGKALSFVTDEAQYRQTVIQYAWERLAPPIRMLLRNQYPRWDAFCLALRDEVLDLSESAVALRPNAEARMIALMERFFAENGTLARRASEAGQEPSLARRANVPNLPLAAPVLAAANPAQSIPIAHPVSPQPGQREERAAGARATVPAVGIDLGTTYSVVAYLDPQGRPCSIPNAAGDVLTPSVVLFDDGGTVVGKQAVQASALEPEKVAECAKRDMGARVYRKKINGEFLPPEMISSLVLRSLKADAERRLGAVCRVVITVPAYFDERRRRATMDAGRMAGLEVLDILNEPTAAAIAYGYQLGFLDRSCRTVGDRPLRVLVFDLGGGTFDVTIVELKANDFRALATDGDVALGGKDWDEKLVELAAVRSRHHFREDPRDNPVSLQDLWLAAEAAKRTLTERPKAALYVNHLGSRCKVEVTRAEFEEATAPLLDRTRLTTEVVVRQAGLTWADIDRVLLVGGSTRMPMVQRMLEELSGKPPDRSVSADEAVAHGAALYAALLAPPQAAEAVAPAFRVTNVNSHSLGILGADPKTGRKFNKILLPKNSPLPRTVSKVCRMGKRNQRNVIIKVLEGESERPEICTLVGECAVRDLPAGLPAGWPVRVSYTYEANGRLHVTARVKGHGALVAADFTHENSLPDEEVELWSHFIAEELSSR